MSYLGSSYVENVFNKEKCPYDERKVRIPQPAVGYIQPAAGKIGVCKYAGFGDEYCIYVDGQYYVRASAEEFIPHLIEE